MNSQKKNGTENRSDNSKSTKNKTSQVKAGDQYVVDGAIFKCQYGSAPSQILAANNQKVLVQGKAMVVDKDTNFKLASLPFGNCTQNKNPQSPVCLYAKGQWNKQTTVEQGGQNALTESSTMTCSIFAGEISCVFPGQIKNVSVADLENTKVQTLSNFPLALVVTFPDLEKDKTKHKTTSVSSVSVSKNTVRIDEQITLHAYKQTKQKDEINYPNFNNWVFFTTKELEEDKENKIKKGTYIDDLKIFKHVWSPINIKLHKPGKYHIEACGDKTLEKYEKLDPNSPLKTENNKTTPPFYKVCEEVVDVFEQNRITRILKDGKETTDSIINVKQGATTVFSPTFLLDYDSNFEDLSCTVEKGNGESVDEGDYSFDVDKKTLSLTPSAGEVNYKITFYLHKKTDEGAAEKPFNEKSISVRSYNEAVLFAYVPTSASKDQPTNNVTLKRPQEGLAFTVKLKDKKGGDFSQVEWKLKKDDIYVDEPLKTKGETALYFFKEEGKYEIEADLTNTSYCNGGVSGSGVQKTSGDITQKIISHKFEISNNYVTDITLNSNNGRRYVGVKYRIDPKFLFGDGTFATERNSVEYKADGADKDCLGQGIFRVDKPGEYKIVATLNGKSFESQAFKIEEAEIKKWEFCDVDNKKIDKIGRNNKFGINASVPAWGATEENSKRTINVSLYCQKKELCAFKTELDKDGNFHVDNIDVEKNIFEEIANKNISHDGDKDLILTFVVFDSPSRIVKNLSRTERMGLFSKHTNLCVKSRPSVDGYFAESNGKRLVKMLTYDDKATARIQVLNYSNERLKNLRFCLYENKRGMDSVVFKSEDFKPDDSGIVEISIPLNEGNIKEEDHGDSKLPRLFYFKVLETSGTCDYYLSKFPIVDGLYQIYSYPQTPGDLYGYDIQQKMSSIQDEALTEMSTNLSGNNYNSETLNNTRSYYYQLKIAAKTEESKKYVNSYNSLAPVVVGEDWEKEEEEAKNTNTKCFCHRDFTVEEVKSILKKLKGDKWNGTLWNKTKKLDDRSIEKFTFELNVAFRKYGIGKCIQKIVFFSIAALETGKFECTEEKLSNHKSSQSKYKGRGFFQLTGELNRKTKFYDIPGVYERYRKRVHDRNADFVNNPELLAEKLHYVIDASCYYFAKYKTIPNFAIAGDANERAAQKKKQEMWANALGKTLNDTSILIETENNEDYYYLINKVLNGYQLKEIKEAPNGWTVRLENFKLLKAAFGYDPKNCKEVEQFYYPHEWHDPLDKMMSCYFSEGGHKKPYNSIFCIRETKNDKGEYRKHPGVDLFAKIRTKVYACLTGEIVNVTLNSDSGGKIIYLRVTSPRQIDILRMRKRYYKLLFKRDSSNGPGEQNTSSDFNISNGFTLVYMHLDDVFVQKGDYVVAGQEIGLSGRTGNAPNSLGPHVHFEIRSDDSYSPVGFKYHANPAEYFYYKQFKREFDKITIFDCDVCTDRSKCIECKGKKIVNPENTSSINFEDYSKFNYGEEDLDTQRETVLELKK